MEYTFKNGPGENEVRVEATLLDLVIEENGNERIIPYAAITAVKLHRASDRYYTEIEALHFGTFRISNRLYTAVDTWKDQSRQYHAFVRMLHHQLLKNQSPAVFCFSSRHTGFLVKVVLLLLLGITVYLVEEYYRFFPLNPILIAVLVSGISMLITLMPYVTNRLKPYSPNNIPLDMLPPA
jgi:hypothetical protein